MRKFQNQGSLSNIIHTQILQFKCASNVISAVWYEYVNVYMIKMTHTEISHNLFFSVLHNCIKCAIVQKPENI